MSEVPHSLSRGGISRTHTFLHKGKEDASSDSLDTSTSVGDTSSYASISEGAEISITQTEEDESESGDESEPTPEKPTSASSSEKTKRKEKKSSSSSKKKSSSSKKTKEGTEKKKKGLVSKGLSVLTFGDKKNSIKTV